MFYGQAHYREVKSLWQRFSSPSRRFTRPVAEMIIQARPKPATHW